ncbi:MAG TPA: tripartite tricarboxylate transporter substrate-binding protein, partial [Burkholderiales bacterium]
MTRVLALLASFLVSFSSWGQAWPAKPVRIIAPFAPGGSADTLGRIVAQKLGESFRQSFVVENRPGAGGAIGSEAVARAAPDGYTLVVSGVASHAIAPSLARGTPYHPIRDFTHIALFGGPPAVLVVNPSVPAKDLHELIALLKKEPGKYSYGSPGNGTHGQLVAELFKQLAGVQMQHVPYKGAAVAISDLMAGHIPVASTTLTTAAGQIHAGKARALALSSETRLPDYPNVPTYAEMGYKDLVA